ncbi:TIGR02117 family protein [Sphingomicrobium arenosum]|uniref:TIGR02117 family protein n=1 Tax=Sphingomicrobium arenosum TaxID=2233861 RepID=UPI002240F41E|nr:TIGR02117 family protein [Sphingomicrobium arenosum]
MASRKRKKQRKSSSKHRWPRAIALVLLAPIAAYLGLALLGSLIPVNADWEEAETGIPIYLTDNGVHLDIVMPIEAAGVSWAPYFPGTDLAQPAWANAGHVMIGSGDRGVYTEAKDWGDLRASTAFGALFAGNRVMHVQYVDAPQRFAAAEIRLTPAQYRRLWQSVRASFDLSEDGWPQRLDTPGYWPSDAFYEGRGSFNAAMTCNQWVARQLRIAGVESSLWSPFSKGLPWRYRAPDAATD